MEARYVVVFITVPDDETAQQVTDALLEKRLVACVNRVAPVHSAYIWEGAIQRDEEILLICKTRAELVEEQLVPVVRSVHPYEVPEIIALPILGGHGAYLNWIDEATEAAGKA
ncbi:MAG: divalent-cation tolerance protein CutA [Chloroflexi bacterium]|nr:divalent-cation tolerance protein CutA [Chloroflexota bacterium]